MTMLGAGAVAPNATVAGVDIGGTKTHLRVRSPAGVDDLILPTSDWRCRDWLSDAKAVTELVKKLADGRCIDALAVGAHGCDDRAECEAFENAFKAIEFAPARVVNDAELMPAAFGLEGQIGVVAGTGSIAVCRSAEGEMLVAGGWGWIIGDEGSAPSLVREAARAVALHFDHGGVPDEPLVQSLFKALDIPTPARIGTCLSNLRSSKEVGRHAHVIFEAANAGSKLADAVISDAGRALADLVKRLKLRGSAATQVVAGGSVIVSQPRLWEAFCSGISERYGTGLSLYLHEGPPVEGAIMLADRLAAKAETRQFGHVLERKSE